MFDRIIQESKWSESHGAEYSHLGAGCLYYFIPYMLKSKTCVCLGSGAGFVPKLMYEAQKRLIQENYIDTISVNLVDADIGPWGRPVYGDAGIPEYPEIKFFKMKTEEAYTLFDNIDYLHVDADHSYDQVLDDLNMYGSKMRENSFWAITVHDTYNSGGDDFPDIGSFQAAVDWSSSNNLSIMNFPIGCGTAMIVPKFFDKAVIYDGQMGILNF